ADVEVTMHSRSSNLYGGIDNDDFFQYLGGLNLAVTYASGGNAPDSYVTNLRAVGGEEVGTYSDFIADELYSRLFNPLWDAGMMEHGYAGGREIKNSIENLFGSQVTNPDLLDWDRVWDQVFETFVDNQAMSEWFNQDKSTAYHYQSMTARMVEIVRKEYWTPSDPDTLKTIVTEYAKSVAEHGDLACCHHTCGNPVLDDDYMTGLIHTYAPEYSETYHELISDTTWRDVPPPSQSTQEDKSDDSSSSRKGTYPPGWFNKSDETTQPEPQAQSQSNSNETTVAGGIGEDITKPVQSSEESNPSEDYVEGQKMEETTELKTSPSSSSAPLLAIIAVVVILALIGIGLRFKRR
ncbi:MAG: cobaltochelatase subunit CobN, partial [Methanosarcinales archaeon]|nr:cobaltochelatase subunit CobN [Methanosarcinales archaeon]